jgi:hypothetical protein
MDDSHCDEKHKQHPAWQSFVAWCRFKEYHRSAPDKIQALWDTYKGGYGSAFARALIGDSFDVAINIMTGAKGGNTTECRHGRDVHLCPECYYSK